MTNANFPGFPGFPAPVPQAGGFPAPAPQAGGFPAPGAAYAQPPQAYAQPPQAYAQPTQAYAAAQPTRILDKSIITAMRGAAMGSGHAKSLPMGSYVVDVESQELAEIGPPNGRKRKVLFLQVVVVDSNNPVTPAGTRGKITRFLESDYDQNKAFGEVLQLVGTCKGCDTTDQLNAEYPDWDVQLETNPRFLAGARLQGQVTQRVDKQRRPVTDEAGAPKTRDDWKRIG